MAATFELEGIELKLAGGPVAGIDEAGRGPWAGPVVAAAVILDPTRIPAGINDSKALEPEDREAIYARLIAGHPVVVFSTWDWSWHPRRDYLSFDGRWIPWIGPVFASHVYTAVGVSPTKVLVNDPIRGQYWVSKAAFEAGYSDFREAIVFA